MSNGFVRLLRGYTAHETLQRAEVFSVKIEHKTREKFQVFGTIYLKDNADTYCIFEQNEVGFSMCCNMVACHSLLIVLSVPTQNSLSCLISMINMGIKLKAIIFAKLIPGKGGNLRRLGVGRIYGDMGCVTIHYTFNQSATIVALDAKLMHHNSEATNSDEDSWVYGSIVVHYGSPFNSRCLGESADASHIMLFNATQPVPLVLDESNSSYKLPLLRSHVILPCFYSRIFKIDLTYSDKGKVEHIQFDKVIPKFECIHAIDIADKEEIDERLFSLWFDERWPLL